MATKPTVGQTLSWLSKWQPSLTTNRWTSTFMIEANTTTNDCLSQIINIHQRVWWIIHSYHCYYQLQNRTSLPVYGNRINYGRRHTHFSVHYIYCFNPWRPHRSRNGLLIFYSDEFWACGVLTCVWMIETLTDPKLQYKRSSHANDGHKILCFVLWSTMLYL